MNHAPEVVDHRVEILRFLKSRFPIYHRSNIFFRDIQYGIQLFLLRRGAHVTYPAAESIAHTLIASLEKEGILVPIDRQSWAVNYPEFRTPQAKPAPAAPKPAAPSAAPKPAAPLAAPKPAAQSAAPKPAAPEPQAAPAPPAAPAPDPGEPKQ
ncbi:MAG TPA: hypothetical protein VL221_12425 [Bacteroidota bacterium]|nr:hypothetical protein [Bacteroidota bacterium]